MDKRHFTVVEKNGKEHGLYVSSTPSSAAKKAVSKLCTSNKSKKVEFYLREITQGSKKKTYGTYLGEMKKLKKPIELKGRIIQYQIKLNLNKRKSSKTKPAKKMRGGDDYFNNLTRYQSDMEFPVKTNKEKSNRNNRLERKLRESQARLNDVQKIQRARLADEEIKPIREDFDEKYRNILQEGMRLYDSNDFNAAFPFLKEAADDGGIPLAATKVASYYLDYSILDNFSLRSAINTTYLFRTPMRTTNSTPSESRKYKLIIGINYLFLALARYNANNEILCNISTDLIETALNNVFHINDKTVKKKIKMIKESKHGWKGYVKKSILDVIEEHNLSPTLINSNIGVFFQNMG